MVITDLGRGGAEGALERLIEKSLILNKNDCLVICLKEGGEVAENLRLLGYHVILLKLQSIFGIPRVLYSLWKIFILNRPLVVHTWLYHADFLGGLAAKLAGVKTVIWSVRSNQIEKGGNLITVYLRYFNAFLSRFIPTWIIYVAKSSQATHELLHYDPKNGLVIPNGYEVDKIPGYYLPANIRNELMIDESDRIILSIARNSPEKDHQTFFTALGEVFQREDNVVALLVGQGVDEISFDRFLNGFSSQHRRRIIFLGPRSDIYQLLLACNFLVVHSKTEAFPNVLAEAMLVGRASVTTDVGDAKYLQSNTGICVEPENPNMMSDAIVELLRLPKKEIMEMEKCASARVAQYFSLNVVTKSYDKLYSQIKR